MEMRTGLLLRTLLRTGFSSHVVVTFVLLQRPQSHSRWKKLMLKEGQKVKKPPKVKKLWRKKKPLRMKAPLKESKAVPAISPSVLMGYLM